MIQSRILQLSFGLGLTLLSTLTLAAPKSELIPFWDNSDESNTTEIDHSEWQQLLDDYLEEHPSGINRFDYGALKEEEEDFKLLVDYLLRLSELDPRSFAKAEQLSYWINFYNALTVYIVTTRYPVKSIKEIKSAHLTLVLGI